MTSGLIARRSFPAGIALVIVGVGLLVMGSVFAVAFLAAGLVMIGNALTRRSV